MAIAIGSIIAIAMVIAGIGLFSFSTWARILATIICLTQILLSLFAYSISLKIYKDAEEWSKPKTVHLDSGFTYNVTGGGIKFGDTDARDVEMQEQKMIKTKLIELAVVLILLNLGFIIKFFKSS